MMAYSGMAEVLYAFLCPQASLLGATGSSIALKVESRLLSRHFYLCPPEPCPFFHDALHLFSCDYLVPFVCGSGDGQQLCLE